MSEGSHSFSPAPVPSPGLGSELVYIIRLLGSVYGDWLPSHPVGGYRCKDEPLWSHLDEPGGDESSLL